MKAGARTRALSEENRKLCRLADVEDFTKGDAAED